MKNAGILKNNTYAKKIVSSILWLTTILNVVFCQANLFNSTSLIKGVSYRGPCDINTDTTTMYGELNSLNANWVAIIPESTLDKQNLSFASKRKPCWAQGYNGTKASVISAHQAGLQVLLKPHIVLEKNTQGSSRTGDATWRGEIKFDDEGDWYILEKNYKEYILKYARLADSLNVKMFCIGTELKEFATKRPVFWIELIRQVRQEYAGIVCYSANWDEYDKIKFWNKLDCIGMNTYFPISDQGIPEVGKTTKNWNKILAKVKKFADSQDKQVLITEFGYRNVLYAGKEPWLHDDRRAVLSDQAQVNLYLAFLNAIKNEPWIIGIFAWEWNFVPLNLGNTDFSIQNKPAFSILKKFYLMN